MPKRMKNAQRARNIWRLVMGASAIYVGVGYAFGPENWYQTPSLELVRRFPLPVPIWGWLMIIAGVLIFTRWRPYGHWIAMLLWTFWFSCIATVAAVSLVAYVYNLLGGNFVPWLPAISGWGAPAYVLVYMMVHMHMVLGPPSLLIVSNCEEDARETG